MTAEDTKFLLDTVSGLGIGAVVAFGVAFLFLRSYVPSYLSEKGKNLATKEDIEQITRIVEEVKHQNSVLLEDRKAHNQLRFAAVDRRLVAHQEAFTHWSTLQTVATSGHTMSDDALTETGKKLREWWYSNAIYLEPDVRLRFDYALITAMRLASMLNLKNQDGTRDSTFEAIETAQGTIRSLGEAIIKAVELPSLTGKEGARYAYLDIKLAPLTGQVSDK